MVKAMVSITLDVDAYIEARKQKVNISKLLSDFLVDYTNTSTGSEEYDVKEDKKKHLELQKIKISKELELYELEEKKHKQALADKFKGKTYWCDKVNRTVDYEHYKLLTGAYPE